LRDYGHDGQIGLEETPDAFVAQLVEVFREVRRVLRDDGTVWLNLGDSYARQGGKESTQPRHWDGRKHDPGAMHSTRHVDNLGLGLKPKDLIGIPWRVAFALQQDGWYLRQDIIWHKPNPMPESVRDRCTKAHEYIFLLTKSERYFYDADAIAEPSQYYGKDARSGAGNIRYEGKRTEGDASANGQQSFVTINETRNKRSVWSVSTKPYSGAHFATFPPDLIEPCILAGSRPNDTVLDPFGGSGTTGMVALQHGRNAVLCELNPEYVAIAEARISEATAQTDMFLQGAM
jgi:DNA modification methylase